MLYVLSAESVLVFFLLEEFADNREGGTKNSAVAVYYAAENL